MLGTVSDNDSKIHGLDDCMNLRIIERVPSTQMSQGHREVKTQVEVPVRLYTGKVH